MNSSIKTLLLYATNFPSAKRVVTDTLREGLHLDLEHLPHVLRCNALIRKILKQGYRSLSYVVDWYDAFLKSPHLDIDSCNINNLFQLFHYLRRIQEYELIIVLHSAAGDHMRTLLWTQSFFQKRKGKLVVCFGNEFLLMPEKIGFARAVEAQYIVSQLPQASAQWLYSDCTKAKIILAPAALNPAVYRPMDKLRTVDLGFRGSLYNTSIGDDERSRFIIGLKQDTRALGLNCDIGYDMMEREAWTDFLNICHGIPGAESGTYYLEKDDHTHKAVMAFLRRHPHESFKVVQEKFFKYYPNPVSGKAISSRHFEPMGTKTCQLLLDGDYNGILRRGEHFIGVKKDLSDLAEAVERFKDDSYRRSITERSYEYAMSAHTYAHRVNSIIATLG